jgi:hypothetical protein
LFGVCSAFDRPKGRIACNYLQVVWQKWQSRRKVAGLVWLPRTLECLYSRYFIAYCSHIGRLIHDVFQFHTGGA